MVRETQLRGTDFYYIIGKEFVIFSNGVTMSLDEFKHFHSKGLLAKKVVTLAKIPQRLSNYQIAKETGVLTPLYLPVKAKTETVVRKKKKRIRQAEVINITPVAEEKTVVEKFFNFSINRSQIIFYAMLFIASGSALMSIYHATTFLVNGGKPFIISFVTALLLVTFAAVGFTTARYFLEQDGWSKIFALPLILITSVLIGYIAFSTTSVSYEQFRDKEAEKSSEVWKEIGSQELYDDMMKSIQETENYIRLLESKNMTGKTPEAFARHQKAILNEREKLYKLREKAFAAKEKAGGSIEEKKRSITSVFDFLMEVFGVNSRFIRFLIYVIPAVFYDIAAPFGFTVVFFLSDKNILKGEKDV